MPSLDSQSPQPHRIDWLGIMRTLLVQALVLAALGGAAIFYLDWSSQKTWAEFSAAAASAPPAPLHQAQTMSRIPGHVRLTCDRSA